MIDTQLIINNEYVQIGLVLIIVLLSYIIGRLLHERKIKKMVVEKTSSKVNDIAIGPLSNTVFSANSPSPQTMPEVSTPTKPELPIFDLRETDLVTQEKVTIIMRDDQLIMNDRIKDLMIDEQIDKMISLTVFISAIILILCFLI
jgi:hypothetical protein